MHAVASWGLPVWDIPLVSHSQFVSQKFNIITKSLWDPFALYWLQSAENKEKDTSVTGPAVTKIPLTFLIEKENKINCLHPQTHTHKFIWCCVLYICRQGKNPTSNSF